MLLKMGRNNTGRNNVCWWSWAETALVEKKTMVIEPWGKTALRENIVGGVGAE
jgi:hypothetical protein